MKKEGGLGEGRGEGRRGGWRIVDTRYSMGVVVVVVVVKVATFDLDRVEINMEIRTSPRSNLSSQRWRFW